MLKDWPMSWSRCCSYLACASGCHKGWFVLFAKERKVRHVHFLLLHDLERTLFDAILCRTRTRSLHLLPVPNQLGVELLYPFIERLASLIHLPTKDVSVQHRRVGGGGEMHGYRGTGFGKSGGGLLRLCRTAKKSSHGGWSCATTKRALQKGKLLNLAR